jgi:hypothetical protein
MPLKSYKKGVKQEQKQKQKAKANPDFFLWFRCVFFWFWPISFSVLVWPLFPFFKFFFVLFTLVLSCLYFLCEWNYFGLDLPTPGYYCKRLPI